MTDDEIVDAFIRREAKRRLERPFVDRHGLRHVRPPPGVPCLFGEPTPQELFIYLTSVVKP